MTLRTPTQLQERYPWLTYHNGQYRVAATTMSTATRERRQRIVHELNAMYAAGEAKR